MKNVLLEYIDKNFNLTVITEYVLLANSFYSTQRHPMAQWH